MNNWPYTNMHELNLDWIISEIKHIEETYGDVDAAADAAIARIQAQETLSVEELNTAKDTILSALSAAQNLAIAAIDADKASALSDIEDKAEEAVNLSIAAINQAGTYWNQHVNSLLADMPADLASLTQTMAIIGNILTGDAEQDMTWFVGDYVGGSKHTYASFSDASTNLIIGGAGLRFTIKLESAAGADTKLYQIVWFTGKGETEGTYTGQTEVSMGLVSQYTWTVPANCYAFSVTVRNSQTNFTSDPVDIASMKWRTDYSDLTDQVEEIEKSIATVIFNGNQNTTGSTVAAGSWVWAQLSPVDPYKLYRVTEDVVNNDHVSGSNTVLIDVENEIDTVKSAVELNSEKIIKSNDGVALLRGEWANGTALQDGTINPAYTYRVANSSMVKYPVATSITIKAGYRVSFRYFDDQGSQTSSTAWYESSATINANTNVLATIARVTEDTTETANIIEFVSAITYSTNMEKRLEIVEGKTDYAVNAKEPELPEMPLLTNAKLGGLSATCTVDSNNVISVTAGENANGNPYVVLDGTVGNFVAGKYYLVVWTGYAFTECGCIASNQASWVTYPVSTMVIDGTSYYYAIVAVTDNCLLSRVYFRQVPMGETITYKIKTIVECASDISVSWIRASISQEVYNIPEKFDQINAEIKALQNADYSFIAYGDSLTAGTGSSGFGYRYVDVLQRVLGAKNKQAFGYGGSGSRAIAFTAGAMSAFVPPSTRTFALKYADLSTNVSIALNQLNGKTVIVGGNEYTITQTDVNAYALPNEYTPATIYTPVIVKNSRYTADFYIIWMGTNDGGLQFDIIDAVISKLGHKKYIVMGLTRLGTDTTTADEEKAMKLYGSHFFNTRVQIINNAFSVLSKTPTAEDTTAMAAGLMPPSLLYDNVHFNDDGYEAIGQLLGMHVKSLGYAYQTA